MAKTRQHILYQKSGSTKYNMQKALIILTYIRAIFHWFWLVFFTVLSILIILSFEITGCKKKSHKATQFWAFGILWFCGIKVKSKNRYTPEKPFLILFNHRSYVDILVLFQSIPDRFHFGSKTTIFSIPVLGFAMRKMGHISIERENPRSAVKVYKSLKERIKKGDCFALSPEGGRHTGSGLARFKKGPFSLAINNQMKILPTLIHKAEECMPKGSWFFNVGAWRRTVTVEYLPTVNTTGMNKTDLQKLQALIYSTMSKRISKTSDNQHTDSNPNL